jgi:predicted double-glycine peptidase
MILTYAVYIKPASAFLHSADLKISQEEDNIKWLRDRRVVMQSSEFTCGPAAVASLLNFYFGEKTTEDEIAKLAGTYDNHTSSLLSLRDACRAKGYDADGFRMTLPQLLHQVETSGVPALVHLKEPTLHYILVVNQEGDSIHVSDPAQGNISMSVSDFLQKWGGEVLVVNRRTGIALQ